MKTIMGEISRRIERKGPEKKKLDEKRELE